jgi:hypothetical protein
MFQQRRVRVNAPKREWALDPANASAPFVATQLNGVVGNAASRSLEWMAHRSVPHHLALALMQALYAADNPMLTLQVSREIVPAGAVAQIKVSFAEPVPLSTGA